MSNTEEVLYALRLSQVSSKISLYYSYSIPWMSIFCDLFALGVLFFRKRREENLLILIFKWEYIISLIYALNMVFNDNVFSYSLFKYVSTQNVADPVCKLHLVLMKYIYCMAPWMQVVVTFDRLWSVVYKLKVKRTKKTLTLFIVGLLGVVFLINLFYLTFYSKAFVSSQSQLDPVLNVTVKVNITLLQCVIINSNIQTAQDMLFVLMRIVIPFVIMFVCSYILFKHVFKARRRIIRGRNQKRENFFTVAITFTNCAFLVFNLPITVYYIYEYYLKFSNTQLSFVGASQNNLLFIVAYLFSYLFTLCQFWIDLALNRVFRKEIFTFVKSLLPDGFNSVFSSTLNNPANTPK